MRHHRRRVHHRYRVVKIFAFGVLAGYTIGVVCTIELFVYLQNRTEKRLEREWSVHG